MNEKRNGRILVVEDDHALIELFKAVLKQAGFEYQSATTVAETQKLLAARHFDALVCDLSVIGAAMIFDLVKGIRVQHPGIAVLIVTGFTPEGIPTKLASQNIGLMEKPFSPDALVARLRTLLNRKAA